MYTIDVDLDTGILVQPKDRETWEQRIHEARVADLGATVIAKVFISDYPADVARVLVDSRTAGDPRLVKAVQKSDPLHGLGTEVACDCPAGVSGHICAHAAAALSVLGWFPFSIMPTFIGPGTYVRITTGKSKGRCGVIDRVREHPKGMQARVVDYEGQENLRYHLTTSLVPAQRPKALIPDDIVKLGVSLLTRKAS